MRYGHNSNFQLTIFAVVRSELKKNLDPADDCEEAPADEEAKPAEAGESVGKLSRLLGLRLVYGNPSKADLAKAAGAASGSGGGK